MSVGQVHQVAVALPASSEISAAVSYGASRAAEPRTPHSDAPMLIRDTSPPRACNTRGRVSNALSPPFVRLSSSVPGARCDARRTRAAQPSKRCG
eukprot:7384940-Prymnesium_polylepis.1